MEKAVLQAEIGAGPVPTLTTTSYASGATRSWMKIEDFMQEVANARIYDGVHYSSCGRRTREFSRVANARIYDGVHYRNSNEVGTAMGKQIGELAAAKFLRPLN